MKGLYYALVVLYIILCIVLTVIVLMQEGKNAGITSLTGSNSNSYWSKNKNRSAEGKLVILTRILAALFIILSIVLALKVWR